MRIPKIIATPELSESKSDESLTVLKLSHQGPPTLPSPLTPLAGLCHGPHNSHLCPRETVLEMEWKVEKAGKL